MPPCHTLAGENMCPSCGGLLPLKLAKEGMAPGHFYLHVSGISEAELHKLILIPSRCSVSVADTTSHFPVSLGPQHAPQLQFCYLQTSHHPQFFGVLGSDATRLLITRVHAKCARRRALMLVA